MFRRIDKDPEARVVILSAAGKMFTSGIDLNSLMEAASVVSGDEDLARKCLALYNKVHSDPSLIKINQELGLVHTQGECVVKDNKLISSVNGLSQ